MVSDDVSCHRCFCFSLKMVFQVVVCSYGVCCFYGSFKRGSVVSFFPDAGWLSRWSLATESEASGVHVFVGVYGNKSLCSILVAA